jgi:hypothetical protein
MLLRYSGLVGLFYFLVRYPDQVKRLYGLHCAVYMTIIAPMILKAPVLALRFTSSPTPRSDPPSCLRQLEAPLRMFFIVSFRSFLLLRFGSVF